MKNKRIFVVGYLNDKQQIIALREFDDQYQAAGFLQRMRLSSLLNIPPEKLRVYCYDSEDDYVRYIGRKIGAEDRLPRGRKRTDQPPIDWGSNPNKQE